VVAALFVGLGSCGNPLLIVATHFPAVVLGAVGLPMGIITARLARQDLQEMTQGRRDP